MTSTSAQKYCGWCGKYQDASLGKQVMTMKLAYAKFKCASCLSKSVKAKSV